jgi:membrane-bound metal-dependent hydrolase YbcI (DUF457 family)
VFANSFVLFDIFTHTLPFLVFFLLSCLLYKKKKQNEKEKEKEKSS